MRMELLREFIVVAKHRNFTKAAQELYTTQPGLSSRISALEKELGYPLFERRRNKVALTSAGTTLLEYAQKIVDLYNEALEESESAAKKVPPIKVNTVAPGSHFHKILPTHEAFPYSFIDLDISTCSLDALHTHILDVAFMTDYSAIPEFAQEAKELGLTYYPYGTTTCFVSMMATHTLAEKQELSRSDFDGQTIIIQSGAHFDRWKKMVQWMLGGEVRLSFRMNPLESLSNLAMADFGDSIYICGGEQSHQFLAPRSDVRVFETVDGKPLDCPAAVVCRTEEITGRAGMFVEECLALAHEGLKEPEAGQ